jgi:hypothetical protein
MLLSATVASAQVIRAVDPVTGRTTDLGDEPNKAVRTLPATRTFTGTMSNVNDAIVFDTTGMGSVSMQENGNSQASYVLEGSNDAGANWSIVIDFLTVDGASGFWTKPAQIGGFSAVELGHTPNLRANIAGIARVRIRKITAGNGNAGIFSISVSPATWVPSFPPVALYGGDGQKINSIGNALYVAQQGNVTVIGPVGDGDSVPVPQYHFNIGGAWNDSIGPLTVPGREGFARITPYRGLHVNLRGQDGTEILPLTDAQLRASEVPVSIAAMPTTAVTGPLTDTQLRAVEVPVSVAALPLPSGGATSALQTTGNTSLAAINTKTPSLGQALGTASVPVVLTAFQQTALTPPAAITGFALEAGHLAALDTKTPALGQALAAGSTPVVLTAAQLAALTPLSTVGVTGTFFQATQPVSLATAPTTPVTGTFWQATQPVSVASMPTTAVTGPLTDTQLRASAVPISLATAPTTPVTGTFWQATQPISAAALPLPALAATSTLQTTGNTSLGSIDTKTPALGQALAAASTPVVLTAAQMTTLTPLSTVGVTGTFWQATQPVSMATAPTTPVTGTFWQATQPVSLASTTVTGSVAVTGPLTDTQLRATPVPVSGTVTTTGLTDTQLRATAVPISMATAPTTPVTGTFWQATQPVSLTSTTVTGSVAVTNAGLSNIPAVGQALAAASLPVILPAATITTLTPPAAIIGYALEAGHLATIDTKTPALGQTTMTASVPVTLASNQSALPVTGTFFQGTQPVSLATAPTTPVTGTFWQATQPVSLTSTTVTGSVAVTNAGLSNIPAVGQALMAASTPVTLASNQTALPVTLATAPTTPVTGTFWQATQPVSGSFFQATQPVSMATAPTTPVTGTFWQATQPVSIASMPTTAVTIAALPALTAGSAVIGHTINDTGSTTAVTGNVAVTNTGLSNIPAQGQALAAASLPVVLTAAQMTTLTPLASVTVTQATGSNLHMACDSGCAAGTPGQTTMALSQPVVIANNQSAIPVTLTSTTVTGSVAVTGPVTDTQLRASAVPVSLASTTVTGSVAVTNAGLSNIPAQGQALAAASLPVVLTAAQLTTLTPLATVTTTPPANASTNVAQMGGVATSMNTGVRDTGTQRVTIATNDVVPVTGTFFQATQPVSMATAPTTPVTGTFFQATQPVSMATAPTTPVTGTFWQATQPVSLAATSVTSNALVSTVNSSTSVLAGAAVFTGTSEDITEYADIRVTIFSDQASATDGLSLQQSSNGTNWDVVDVYSIPAATGKTFSTAANSKFFRVVYTNGATLQTAFRLQTIYRKTYTKGSSQRPQDGRTNDNDTEETSAFLMAFNGTTWDRVTIDGNNTDAEPVATTGMIEVVAANTMYNGTTWDRVRGTIANGMAVDVTRVTGNVAVTATPITLTKGTQGATGFTTQDLKDAGRVVISLTASIAAPTVADTVYATLIKNSGGVAAAGAQSIVQAGGKILRLTAISGQIRATAVSLPWAMVTLRMSNTTTCTAASSVVAYLQMGGTAAAVGNTGGTALPLSDGVELPAGGSFCISVQGNVTTNALTFAATGFEY